METLSTGNRWSPVSQYLELLLSLPSHIFVVNVADQISLAETQQKGQGVRWAARRSLLRV